MMYATAREKFARVAKRPSMYGLDGRYITAVAFVTGYDQALGMRLLVGFGDWLCGRANKPLLSNLFWGAVIEYLVFPDFFEQKQSAAARTPEQDRALVQYLFAQLDAFLTEKSDGRTDS